MLHKFRRLIIQTAGLVALGVVSLNAQTVQMTIADTTAKQGDTLKVPLRVNSISLSDSVYSGQFTLSYNSSVINIFGVDSGGTILGTAGDNVLFNSTTKVLAFSGSTRLSGSGVLLYLKTRVIGAPGTQSGISVSSASLNEGRPTVGITAGGVRVLAIQISPKIPSTALIVGDSLQFTVSGDQQPPLLWTTSDTTVGKIDGTGKLRLVASGQLKVYVKDIQGLQDSTSLFGIYPLQAKSLTVSLHDTSYTQTLYFNLPLYISNVTGLGIISSQFTLTYNATNLQAISVITANSKTATWIASPPNITSGRVDVALAGSDTLTGAGVLCFVRFRVLGSAAGTTTISPSNALFNENLSASTVNGQFTALTAPAVVVTPNSATLTKGDTLRFKVTSGGTAPFNWSSSNTLVASIDPSTGLLTALKAGTTSITVIDVYGFSATTGLVTVNDLSVKLPDTSMFVADTIAVPLLVSDLTGLNVLSYETKIVYDSTVVRFIGPLATGTKSDGFTIFYKDTLDTLRLAASNSLYVAGAGTLVKLKFVSTAPSPGGRTTLNFTKLQFNEGSPTATMYGGAIRIRAGDTATTGLSATVPEPGDPHQRPRWAYTGVDVGIGDTLVITATGLVNDGGGNSAGPNGTGVGGDPNPSFPDWYNSVSHISLVGRLRLSNESFSPLDDGVDASGSGVYGPGFVGSTFKAVMASSGSVELSINDGDTGNNSGSFTALVKRIPGLSGAPFPPTLYTPTDSATDVARNLTLRWFRGLLATSYRLQVSTIANFSTTLLDTSGIADTLCLLTNLTSNTTYFWRVQSINVTGTSPFTSTRRFTTGTSTDVVSVQDIPSQFQLSQNYPNPFNPSTTIEYQVPKRTRIRLAIYSILGELVKDLVDSEQEPGVYKITWSASLPSGVYFYRMQAGDFSQTRKLLLMK